jgi:hypothetical protein
MRSGIIAMIILLLPNWPPKTILGVLGSRRCRKAFLGSRRIQARRSSRWTTSTRSRVAVVISGYDSGLVGSNVAGSGSGVRVRMMPTRSLSCARVAQQTRTHRGYNRSAMTTKFTSMAGIPGIHSGSTLWDPVRPSEDSLLLLKGARSAHADRSCRASPTVRDCHEPFDLLFGKPSRTRHQSGG